MAEPIGEPAADPDAVGRSLLAEAGVALADAVDAAIGPWIEASVATRLGRPLSDDDREAVRRATAQAQANEGARLRALLALDLDEQWTNPLAVIRSMTAYPTAILSANGAPAAARDDHAVAFQPDDVYDLTPASFADFGPEVHEPGLIWGAAKAHLHLKRRKAKETA